MTRAFFNRHDHDGHSASPGCRRRSPVMGSRPPAVSRNAGDPDARTDREPKTVALRVERIRNAATMASRILSGLTECAREHVGDGLKNIVEQSTLPGHQHYLNRHAGVELVQIDLVLSQQQRVDL